MSIQSAISFSTAMQSGLTFAAPEGLSVVEQAKRLAARRAVDEHWPADATVVGIGSGSTVVYVVERIRELGPERTGHVVFIPTGFQSMQLITGSGLRLGAIEHYPVMDIAFDGADECDANLDVIKGGGACLFQEKLVALGARKFVVVAGKCARLCTHGWRRLTTGRLSEELRVSGPAMEARSPHRSRWGRTELRDTSAACFGVHQASHAHGWLRQGGPCGYGQW